MFLAQNFRRQQFHLLWLARQIISYNILNQNIWFLTTQTTHILNLGQCRIDQSPFIVFLSSSFSNLKQIVIRDNGLGQQAIMTLHQKLSNSICKLDLNKNFINYKIALLLDSDRFEGLTLLNLSDNILGDKGVAELAKVSLPNLVNLVLSKNGITNKGCASVAALNVPILRALWISSNRITNDGIKCLVKALLPRLVCLSLQGNNLNDDAMKILWKCSFENLKKIYFCNTKETPLLDYASDLHPTIAGFAQLVKRNFKIKIFIGRWSMSYPHAKFIFNERLQQMIENKVDFKMAL